MGTICVMGYDPVCTPVVIFWRKLPAKYLKQGVFCVIFFFYCSTLLHFKCNRSVKDPTKNWWASGTQWLPMVTETICQQSINNKSTTKQNKNRKSLTLHFILGEVDRSPVWEDVGHRAGSPVHEPGGHGAHWHLCDDKSKDFTQRAVLWTLRIPYMAHGGNPTKPRFTPSVLMRRRIEGRSLHGSGWPLWIFRVSVPKNGEGIHWTIRIEKQQDRTCVSLGPIFMTL